MTRNGRGRGRGEEGSRKEIRKGMGKWEERHDVVTAEDMKAALESHGGIKGCRAAVVDEVDTTKERNKDSKIPGISVLNNFQFEESGIRVWKAYNIGPGRFIPYSDLTVASQGDTGLSVIQPFGPATQKGSVGESIRHKSEIYSCQETGCVLTFKTRADAESHMDTGKHRLEVERESMYDRVRRKWAAMVTGVMFAPNVPSTSLHSEDISRAARAPALRLLGWALKVAKRPTRMTDKVKTFLTRKFEDGLGTGNKADPVQVAREMKTLRDEDGQSTFKPEEWRTAQQISSLFSRQTVVQRHKGVDAEEILEEDIEAAESEVALSTLRSLAMDDLSKSSHPIIVGASNICELVKTNKLGSLKVAFLKEICEKLHLKTTGPLSRKKTFIDAIEAFSESCACFQK